LAAQGAVVDGFTRRYNVTKLVWYGLHGTMDSAITREKQLRKWNREWKLRLVSEANPEWRDLWDDIVGYDSSAESKSEERFPPSRE
jgi:putative endonuclease